MSVNPDSNAGGVPPLPESIRDTAAVLADMTRVAVVKQLEAGETPPALATADDLLRTLLGDPFTLGHMEPGPKARAADFIWRLGIARDLVPSVLSHAYDSFTTDENLGPYHPSRESEQAEGVAVSLFKKNPQILRDATPDQAFAIWKLTGYDPEGDGDQADELLEAMAVLKEAAYIPERVVSQAREYRDTTSTMVHESEISATFIHGVVTVEQRDPSDREKELTEAARRVIFSAFVARHSEQPEDASTFARAAVDLSRRALEDATGLECGLDILLALDEVGLAQHENTKEAFNALAEHMSAFAGRIDTRDIDFNSLVTMVDRAFAINQSVNNPQLRAFIDRAAGILADFQAFYELGAAITEDTSPSVLTHQKLLETSRSQEAWRDYRALRAKLQGEAGASRPTLEDVLSDFSENGYSERALDNAMDVIANELDPDRRARIRNQLDQSIEYALARIDASSALAEPSGLLELIHSRNQMTFLPYFRSGQRFLDRKMREYVRFATDHLEHPDRWLTQQEYPDYQASWFIKNIHDALWYNRAFYLSGFGISGLETAMRLHGDTVKFVLQHQRSPGAARITVEATDGIAAFIDYLKAQADTIGSFRQGGERNPLRAILLGYLAAAA